jgi:hypothetical protein
MYIHIYWILWCIWNHFNWNFLLKNAIVYKFGKWLNFWNIFEKHYCGNAFSRRFLKCWYRISMCFTCFSCQFVFNKRFLKIYCLSVHSFLSCFIYFNVYNIDNYQQKVFRSELNLDIFFTCWSHFFLNSLYVANKPKSVTKIS